MNKGARFFRCDFQVHTPRDINWTGPNAVTDEEREAYAAGLVASCREKGLSAIAITDHHDLAFVPFIRTAAENELDDNGDQLPESNRLVVYPGMELTLEVPCQAILVFDAALPQDLFSLALAALAITPSDSAESKTAPTLLA